MSPHFRVFYPGQRPSERFRKEYSPSEASGPEEALMMALHEIDDDIEEIIHANARFWEYSGNCWEVSVRYIPSE